MLFYVKKTHSDAKLPSQAHTGDAGYDIYSIEDKVLEPNVPYLFKAGFQASFSEGYVCHIWDRSGLGLKGIKTLGGVVDSGYRGEYGVMLINLTKENIEIKKGDRIGQLVFSKIENPIATEVVELVESQRGLGFGSSGR